MSKAEVWIPLGRGKVTVIDFEDFEKVRGIRWRFDVSCRGIAYAVCSKRSRHGKNLYLHRLIWGEENIPLGFEIAHKDGDGLNCRRSSNLKCVTHSQNLQGRRTKKLGASSQYRGVSWNTRDKIWHAQLKLNGKVFYLGSFDCEVKAAHAYDSGAIKYFGEHASCNFPKEISNAA